MPTSYPGEIDNFTDPTANDTMDGAVGGPTVYHDIQHAELNDAVKAIETTIGTTGGGPGTAIKTILNGTYVPDSAKSPTWNLSGFATGGAGTEASPYTGWEAPLATALALVDAATINVDALCRQATCVHLPTTGQYRFVSPARGSVFDYNAGGAPAGIITAGDLTGQPTGSTGWDTQAAKSTYLFSCDGGTATQLLDLVFDHVMFYRTAYAGGHSQAVLFIYGNVANLTFDGCCLQNLGFYNSSVAPPAYQMTICTIKHNFGWKPWIYDVSPPLLGEIVGNFVYLGKINSTGAEPPLPNAQFLQCTQFWSWWISHNYFQYQSVSTTPGAVVYYSGIAQTQDGSIHDNVFYGTSDAAIYVKGGWADTLVNAQGGLQIHDNQFTCWNTDNPSSALGAAVYIDTPVSGKNCDVQVGENQYHGGNFLGGANTSNYFVVANGNPATYGTVISPNQQGAGAGTAKFLVNSVASNNLPNTAGGYVLLAYITLAAPAATVTLSIPATATHLVLKGQARVTGAVQATQHAIFLNNDFNPHYCVERFHETTAGAFVGSVAHQSDISADDNDLPGASATAGVAGRLELKIPNYTQTAFYKNFAMESGYYDNTAGHAALCRVEGCYESTAAISSILLAPVGGSNYDVGTSFSLYGET